VIDKRDVLDDRQVLGLPGKMLSSTTSMHNLSSLKKGIEITRLNIPGSPVISDGFDKTEGSPISVRSMDQAIDASSAPAPPQFTDTTGQVAPPGCKPRVTATLWEEEGTLCFQVESSTVCVARREGEPHDLGLGNHG
jgi:hypothetical protein